MKLFLSTLLIFVLTLILIVIGIHLLYKYQLDQVKFNDETTTLYCGDSHIQGAINDSILEETINISLHGQTYLYTYNVLKNILKRNSQIKSVVLGCSFHNFSQYQDCVNFIPTYANSFYQFYFPILDYESCSKIVSKNPTGALYALRDICKNEMIALVHNYQTYQDYPFCGTYYSSANSNLSDSGVTARINEHYYSNELEFGFSESQEYYLNKISNLCTEHTIELILINTPVSQRYYQHIPKKFVSHYYSVVAGLGNQVELLDFHSLDLQEKYFGDADHLNYSGAKIFTMKLDSLTKNQK